MIRLLAKSPCRPTDHRYLDSMGNHELYDQIVAYKTKPHCDTNESGLGILYKAKKGSSCENLFGFIYHKNLLAQELDSDKMTYTDRSRIAAVTKCAEAGREVFMFNSFDEFINFAAKNCEY